MRLRWLALVTASVLALQVAAASDDVALEALRRGGAIALVRHGDAPGIGDPAGWKLGDCPSQRNLSETGRAQARVLGERLRQERIAVSRVLASPWCRTLETARLMAMGPVTTEATFANAYVLSERRDELAAGARALLSAWRGPGTLLVVTHGENIQALLGRSPAQAELLVVLPQADGSLREVGALRPPRR